MSQKISTFIMFDGKAEAAMKYYCSVFKHARIVSVEYYQQDSAGVKGKVKNAILELDGQTYQCIDSAVSHNFSITPAISLYVKCESVKEIDQLFKELSKNGKTFMDLGEYEFSERYAWIQDQFGVSWQLSLEPESEEAPPKFEYTIMYVEDVAASISFYEKAFGFSKKFITPEKDYGEIKSGECNISFASIELANSNLRDGFIPSMKKNKPFGIELGLITKNAENLISKALKAGAIEVEPLTQKPWGQKVAYLRDLNGFLIEIGTPLA